MSGVRSSWLTFAKNSLFTRSSSRSRSFAVSRSIRSVTSRTNRFVTTRFPMQAISAVSTSSMTLEMKCFAPSGSFPTMATERYPSGSANAVAITAGNGAGKRIAMPKEIR